MIELLSFLLGAGFSILVYQRSIGPRPDTPARKLVYFILSFTGITGMVFLFGVMAAHVLRGEP